MRMLICSLGIALGMSIGLIRPRDCAEPSSSALLAAEKTTNRTSAVGGIGFGGAVAPGVIKLLADPIWEKTDLGRRSLGETWCPREGKRCQSSRGCSRTENRRYGSRRPMPWAALYGRRRVPLRRRPELLRDPIPAVRTPAAAALVQIGTGVNPVLEKKDNAPTSPATLLQLAAGVKAAVPQAIALLDDPCWDVRRLAAEVLGGIRRNRAFEAIPEAVPARTRCLADEDPAVRVSAAAALAAVSPTLECRQGP